MFAKESLTEISSAHLSKGITAPKEGSSVRVGWGVSQDQHVIIFYRKEDMLSQDQFIS